MVLETIGNTQLYLGFGAFVLLMLAIDLGVFHREAHTVSLKEAAVWSAIWIILALCFNVGIYHWHGSDKALEFLTGYLIEKALSVDNLFVFAVVFSYFSVPAIYHHRVLFYGILGALIMRGVFVFLGTAIVQQFHWVLYIFGFLLVVTGVKMMTQKETQVHPEKNLIFRLFKRIIPAVGEYHEDKFFIRKNGKLYATLLFFVLLALETTDIVFAIDSIPAIFAITLDPFIVFTSNIFAILGLRAMYFLLAQALDRLHYLKVGLSLVLIYIGLKMLIADWYKIPIDFSLSVVALLILCSVLASLARPPGKQS